MADDKDKFTSIMPMSQDGYLELMKGGTTLIRGVDANGEQKDIYISVPSDEEAATDDWWWKFNMSFIITLLTEISGKQSTVLKTVLENVDSYNNMILTTQAEIAIQANASRKTVVEVFKLLEEHEIIRKYRQGVYIVNPRFLSQGGKSKYQKLMRQWYEAGTLNRAANKALKEGNKKKGDDEK